MSTMLGRSLNGKMCESSCPEYLCEDLRSYLAREGGVDYNWISGVLLDSPAPADDEDFIAYFARFNGIVDPHSITHLRHMLTCNPQQPHFPPINFTTLELPYDEEEEEEDEGEENMQGFALQCDKKQDMGSLFEAAESSGVSVCSISDNDNGSSSSSQAAAGESSTIYSVLQQHHGLEAEGNDVYSFPYA